MTDKPCGMCGGSKRIAVTTPADVTNAGWADCPQCSHPTDNTQSDVVEAELENALCAPSWGKALEHVHAAQAALASTKDSDGLVGELDFSRIVEATLASRVNYDVRPSELARGVAESVACRIKGYLTALTSSDAVLEEVERHLTNAVKRLTVHEDEIGDADQLKINCDKALAHVECAIAAIRKGDNA